MGLERAFRKILAKIIKAECSVNKVMLTDRLGRVVSFVSKFSSPTRNLDELGATAMATLYAAEFLAESSDLGSLNIITWEYDYGKIFLGPAGNHCLLLIYTDKDTCVGMIRIVLKSAGSEIEQLSEPIHYWKDWVL